MPLPVRIDKTDLSFAARTHVGDLGIRLEPERPNVVIFAIIERFLGMLDGTGLRQLPADLTGPDFTDLTGSSARDLAAHTSRG